MAYILSGLPTSEIKVTRAVQRQPWPPEDFLLVEREMSVSFIDASTLRPGVKSENTGPSIPTLGIVWWFRK